MQGNEKASGSPVLGEVKVFRSEFLSSGDLQFLRDIYF